MRVTVERQLNAHFVDIDSPLAASFTYDGVGVNLAAQVPADRTFASVTCTGTVDVQSNGVGQPRPRSLPASDQVVTVGSQQYVIRQDIDGLRLDAIAAAIDLVGGVLEQVGSVIRWRFGLAGRDAVFAESRVEIVLDNGQLVELQPLGQAAMGDRRAVVGEPGWSMIPGMVESEMREPIGHQLLREAWNLRHANPRGSLIIGVAAAEVGIKQLIASLVPAARSLVEDLPAPPLPKVLKHTLPELPIRADVAPERRCPKALHKLLDEAVQDRNAVVHRGTEPTVHLHATLEGIREFLYLLDFYDGRPWAVDRLSETSLSALGITRS